MENAPLVLMLAHSYYPNDPRIRRGAQALVRSGFRVRVVGTSLDGTPKRWNLDGVETWETAVVKTRQSPVQYLSQYLRSTLACRRAVKECLRSDPPAVVHVHTLPDILVYAATPARRAGIPVILDFHESLPDFFGSKFHRPRTSPLVRLLEWVERRCAGKADHLITVNDVIAEAFHTRLGRRPFVVMNTVDEELFSWRHDRPPWPQGPKHLGYHGTITDIYGLDLLLKALPPVLERFPGTTLELFGDGPARPRLQAMASELGIADAVHFHGLVPLERMPDMLRTIHLGVVPTRKDYFLDMSLSTKLMEYVYLGIPVISSDLSAIQHVFSSRPGVFYFTGNDVDSLTSTLLQVLALDPEEIARATTGARQDYAPHAWPKTSRRFVEFVRGVVNRNLAGNHGSPRRGSP